MHCCAQVYLCALSMTINLLNNPVYSFRLSVNPLIIKRALTLLATVGLFADALAIEPRGESWKDSYSANGQCYCDSTFDHDVGVIVVETPAGPRTVFEVCEAIGPGPGSNGNPIYNDVQCGNGPPNDQADEVLCPGRVDIGEPGCFVIGPTWNLDNFFTAPQQQPAPESEVESAPEAEPSPEPEPASETAAASEPAASPEPVPTQSPTVSAPATVAVPETEQSPEPVAAPAELTIEAENFTASNTRWLMQDGVQDYTNDPFFTDTDSLHLVGSSGGRYLEILPDKKHTDAETAFGAVWPVGGEGPQIHYEVEFAETGRYQVMVRGFSSGDFDKRIHVGLDGVWPSSAAGVEICGAKDVWSWSADCGTVHWLDVLVPGVHSVQFSAFDDGFEMDQFRMVKVADLGLAAALDLPGTADTSDNDAGQQSESSGGGIDSGANFTDENTVAVGSNSLGVGSIASLLLAVIAGLLGWRWCRPET